MAINKSKLPYGSHGKNGNLPSDDKPQIMEDNKMTREELIKGLEEELNLRTEIDDFRYIVKQPNGKIVAMFLRRWEAEKFIEDSQPHDYKLVVR